MYWRPFCTKFIRLAGGTSFSEKAFLCTMASYPNVKAACAKPATKVVVISFTNSLIQPIKTRLVLLFALSLSSAGNSCQ